MKQSRPVRICKFETRSYDAQDPRTNLLVRNIAKEVSAHQIWKNFRAYGDIRSSKLVLDYLGNSKGYAFVSYFKVPDALKAVEEMVNFMSPKLERERISWQTAQSRSSHYWKGQGDQEKQRLCQTYSARRISWWKPKSKMDYFYILIGFIQQIWRNKISSSYQGSKRPKQRFRICLLRKLTWSRKSL